MLSLVRRGPAAPSSDGSAQRQQLLFPKAILFPQIPRKGSKPTQALEGGQGRGREREMVRQTSVGSQTHLIAVTVKMLTFSLWAVSCKLHCP